MGSDFHPDRMFRNFCRDGRQEERDFDAQARRGWTSSLVLTESSYFERLDFESPLDQMLRADVLRHPVLFIGYSLSDVNVRYLLHKLSRIWKEAGQRTERPSSHIFMANPNPVAEAIFQRWGVNPIIEPSGHPKEGLRDFLLSITPAR